AANEEIFAKSRRMLPQPWPYDSAKADWSRDDNGLTLRVKSKALENYPSVDFAPLPDQKTVIGHPVVERSNEAITFRIPIESGEVKSIPGIVVFGSKDDSADRNAWQLTDTPTVATARPALPNESKGLATFLLFGFLGGFILNLMPCVLPVISLKIFGFIQHAGKDRRVILRNGLAFIAGIFLWFVGLAVLLISLKAAGHQITWAAQFTNPYFVLGLSVLVLVFALDLFGVFEINLPQAFMHRLLHSATREGEAGSFFQGLFATALATPCTAPFLGTAIGFAFTQSPAVILAMFLAVATGMSAPYFLLSAQPAWLRFVPKPGAWMERVKQFMGFLLLATLLFLLYVLGAQRGTEAVIWSSSFLLVISIACWMKGAFVTPLASFATKSIVLTLIFALVIGSGIYFIGDKFAQTKLEAASVSAAGGWQNFTPEKLEGELAQGRAVFIDFTAAWCVTCKFNEATVLETSAVREAFQRRGIVKLKADWTNADPVITKYLKQFGRPGVPLYVLYPSGKSAEPIILPELLTKNIVLEKLATVAPQVAAE
ncbi:MAG: thioredoxin family protein, partial [Verrucomicrobiota bacterium]|nr:thioredoxin family protein [Verrucomicrobiota bacterium]